MAPKKHFEFELCITLKFKLESKIFLSKWHIFSIFDDWWCKYKIEVYAIIFCLFWSHFTDNPLEIVSTNEKIHYTLYDDCFVNTSYQVLLFIEMFAQEKVIYSRFYDNHTSTLKQFYFSKNFNFKLFDGKNSIKSAMNLTPLSFWWIVD